jgi:opacity protein-like surface antigen
VGVAQGNFDFSRGYYNDNGYDNLHQRLSGVQFAAGIETFVWRDVSVRVENVLTHYDRGVVRKFSTWELQPDVLTSRIGIAYHPGWLGQPQTAPAETPTVRSWSGLYVGGQAGAAMFHTIDDYVSNGYMPTSSYSSSSAEAGLYAGFNMQVGNIVAGIEADGAATNQRAIDGTNSLYGTQKWSGAVRGRVGRAFGNTFVYGSLGWTVSQFDYSEVYPDTTNANGAFTANGLQAGFGAETFVTPNISVRADGLYSDYGRNIVVWKPSLGSDHVLNPRTLEGRLGLSYHLN